MVVASWPPICIMSFAGPTLTAFEYGDAHNIEIETQFFKS